LLLQGLLWEVTSVFCSVGCTAKWTHDTTRWINVRVVMISCA
jgi:hypothetical protein